MTELEQRGAIRKLEFVLHSDTGTMNSLSFTSDGNGNVTIALFELPRSKPVDNFSLNRADWDRMAKELFPIGNRPA